MVNIKSQILALAFVALPLAAADINGGLAGDGVGFNHFQAELGGGMRAGAKG